MRAYTSLRDVRLSGVIGSRSWRSIICMQRSSAAPPAGAPWQRRPIARRPACMMCGWIATMTFPTRAAWCIPRSCCPMARRRTPHTVHDMADAGHLEQIDVQLFGVRCHAACSCFTSVDVEGVTALAFSRQRDPNGVPLSTRSPSSRCRCTSGL